MFSIIVDAGRLGTAANLAQEMEVVRRLSTASPPARRGGARAQRRASRSGRRRRARLADGVPVDSVTWGEIVAAGGKVGLAAGDIEALARRR